jgi:putative DNA primase/helicase
MPEVAPPVWANIPAELAQRQQWLLWKFDEPEKPGQKWRKVPYYVAGGRRAGGQGGDHDRHRLATLEVVRRAFDKGGWHGVGFGFLPGDGYIGIDIDGAIDKTTGEVSPRCLGIVAACASYTEYSPSGTGCHVIVRGETKTEKTNDIGVEMFCGSQRGLGPARCRRVWNVPSRQADRLPRERPVLPAWRSRAARPGAA